MIVFLTVFLLLCVSSTGRATPVSADSLETFSTALKGISLCPCQTCNSSLPFRCTNCTSGFTNTGNCHETSNSQAMLYTFTPGVPGVVRLMWFTGDLLWAEFGNVTIRVFVDDEQTTPAIAFRLYESHALGFGWNQGEQRTWGNRHMGKGALFGGLYMGISIPFQSSIRITAQLSSADFLLPQSHGFYFIARGLLHMPVIIDGSIQLPPTSKLRLVQTRLTALPHSTVTLAQSPSMSRRVSGSPFDGVTTKSGLVLGVSMLASSGSARFLEGEFKAVIDGVPMVLSSGTEDYFLSAQYFDAGAFQLPLSGCNHLSLDCLVSGLGTCRVAAYRFHDVDPIIFHKNLSLTWEVGDAHWNAMNTSVVFYVWLYEW